MTSQAGRRILDRQVRLKSRPDGIPQAESFAIVAARCRRSAAVAVDRM